MTACALSIAARRLRQRVWFFFRPLYKKHESDSVPSSKKEKAGIANNLIQRAKNCRWPVYKRR